MNRSGSWLKKKILNRIMRFLSPSRLESLINYMVRWQTESLEPKEALRFLLSLDTTVYTLSGRKAVQYGGGIHTKHKHTRYHNFFVDRIHRGEKVLDIGCGLGALAHEVATKTGGHVVAIDLNADNIAQAREKFSHPEVEYLVRDAEEAIPSGVFDVVILSNILEHLPQRPAFLQRVQDVSKPQRFLIRVPLFERDWRVPLKQEIDIEWRSDLTHETEYTLESFEEEMSTAGMAVSYKEVRWGELWAEVRPGETA
jgi:2-polyprenyl-3-methyl-5-hydroxy-6-metoxy-1,4-benzoquinol methylase